MISLYIFVCVYVGHMHLTEWVMSHIACSRLALELTAVWYVLLDH